MTDKPLGMSRFDLPGSKLGFPVEGVPTVDRVIVADGEEIRLLVSRASERLADLQLGPADERAVARSQAADGAG